MYFYAPYRPEIRTDRKLKAENLGFLTVKEFFKSVKYLGRLHHCRKHKSNKNIKNVNGAYMVNYGVMHSISPFDPTKIINLRKVSHFRFFDFFPKNKSPTPSHVVYLNNKGK